MTVTKNTQIQHLKLNTQYSQPGGFKPAWAGGTVCASAPP